MWVTSELTTARPPALDGDGVAADVRVLEGLDELVGTFDRLGLGAFDVGHHQGVVAVGAAQRRRIAERPVGHGEVDVLEAGDELGDLDRRRPVSDRCRRRRRRR